MSIVSISELIERLEAIKADLNPRSLSPGEYEQVGWAVRPINCLLDQCREEAESSSWAQFHSQQFARILPKALEHRAPSSTSSALTTGEISP